MEVKIAMESGAKPLWFAMRATYHRELKLHNTLRVDGVESFVPLEYKLLSSRGMRGEKRRVLVPMVANYIFIRATPQQMQQIKSETPYLRYVVDRERNKITIPEGQMREFIKVSSTNAEGLVYLRPEEVDIRRGERVRVHGGAFDGAQGVFIKVDGRRNRRFVVLLDGVMAVAAKIDADMIERL